MGLHIYSGSLVRYFTNDWENEIQRYARENGIEYQMHYADGEPKWPAREAAADHITWMKTTLSTSPGVGANALLWNDEVEPYHTIKLHDEAREAIAIISAHLQRPDLPMPSKMPAVPGEDAAYAEAGSKGYLVTAIAPLEASLVIPGSYARISMIEDPLGQKRLTCSTARLREALDSVQKRVWADGARPAEWLERGLVYARNSSSSKEIDGSWVEERDEEPENSLRENAEFAFAVLTSMLAFSDRHHCAIVSTW
jgi:hypothetical protein